MMTQLLSAIGENDRATALWLIEHGVNINCVPSPLICAAQRGDMEILTKLLDARAEIDVVDSNQIGACHAALLGNHFDALKFLVERGANVGGADHSLLKALVGLARSQRDDRFAILLLDAGAPLDALTNDDLMNLLTNPTSVGVLKRLLVRNVDASALRDSSGSTLCHRWISIDGPIDEEFARASIELAGADVDAVDGAGMTPLHFAAVNCNVSALRLLVEFGADIDRQRPSDGSTPFHLLLRDEWAVDGECVEFLLAVGADVCLGDRHGKTVCHAAALNFNSGDLCAFLSAGGDLDQPDRLGDTARAIAIRNNCRVPGAADVDYERAIIARSRLNLVRHRAFDVCVGLQSLNINALQLCEIMKYSCGAFGSLIAFHQWWSIAIAVKHFKSTGR
jgi:ankyrin repeat protein